MLIDHPASQHIHQLRQLWKTAFGDTDAFLDSFFRTAFACDRCRCVLEADTVTAVLYWFDCVVSGQKTAYIYAVATHPDHRGQGLCRRLMADTHALLKSRGYASAILVPQTESLRKMYAGMGYRDAGGLEILECTAGAAVPVRAVGPAEFAQLRRQLLPEGSVIQEGENLVFLSEQLRFYAGDRFLLAAYEEKGRLHGMEFLGDPAFLPGITGALGCTGGVFRMPGQAVTFAMFHPLAENASEPSYFGFAFD